MQDLAPGQGGVITISGVVSNLLAAGIFTNTVSITTTSGDGNTGNDEARAGVTVRDTAQRNAYIPVIRKD